MTIRKLERYDIAVVESEDVLIHSVDSALDLAMSVVYDTGARKLIVDKAAFCEAFFDLSTRLAGEALQKYVNYGVKLAVVGNFAQYASKSLRDFIRESNRGRDFFFVSTFEEAVDRLIAVGDSVDGRR